MNIQVIEENQQIVFYRGNIVYYKSMIVDLDRIYMFGEIPLSHHVVMLSLFPWKKIDVLYQLGKIIQSKFPLSISAINWPSTYFYVEFEEYIDKLASIEIEINDRGQSMDYVDKVIHERYDLWDTERQDIGVVKLIGQLVRCRFDEFEIQIPNTGQQ